MKPNIVSSSLNSHAAHTAFHLDYQKSLPSSASKRNSYKLVGNKPLPQEKTQELLPQLKSSLFQPSNSNEAEISVEKSIRRLQAVVRRFLLQLRLEVETRKILTEAGALELLPDAAYYHERRLATDKFAAAALICRTGKRFLIKIKNHKNCARIQRWIRKVFRRWKKEEIWLSQHHVEGIVVAVEDVMFVRNCLKHLVLRQSKHGHKGRYGAITPANLLTMVSISTMDTIRLFYCRTTNKRDKNEFTECIQPYHPRCVQSTSNSIPSIVAMQRLRPAGLQFMMAYATQKQRLALRSIRRRGQRLFHNELSMLSQILKNDRDMFRERSTSFMHVQVNQPSLLFDLIYTIRNKMFGAYCPISLDRFIFKQAASIRIQRNVRAMISRKICGKKFAQGLLLGRAVVLLQRWWRIQSGLLRRLKLLQRINRSCRAISSKVLYLDAWIYYNLLRKQFLPPVQGSTLLYPEYRGVPTIDEKEGKVIFSAFRVDMADNEQSEESQTLKGRSFDDTLENNKSQLRQTSSIILGGAHSGHFSVINDVNAFYRKQYDAGLKVRFGIPQWASWRPATIKPLPSFTSRSQVSWVIYSLLATAVNVKMETFFPSYKDATKRRLREELSDRSEFGFRMIRLEFQSTAEAKIRNAMLMLCSCELRTLVSVELLSFEGVLQRMQPKSELIAETYRRNYVVGEKDGSHVKLLPVESCVVLGSVPSWVLPKTVDIVDVVRFRFLCESFTYLSQQKDNREDEGEDVENKDQLGTSLLIPQSGKTVGNEISLPAIASELDGNWFCSVDWATVPELSLNFLNSNDKINYSVAEEQPLSETIKSSEFLQLHAEIKEGPFEEFIGQWQEGSSSLEPERKEKTAVSIFREFESDWFSFSKGTLSSLETRAYGPSEQGSMQKIDFEEFSSDRNGGSSLVDVAVNGLRAITAPALNKDLAASITDLELTGRQTDRPEETRARTASEVIDEMRHSLQKEDIKKKEFARSVVRRQQQFVRTLHERQIACHAIGPESWLPRGNIWTLEKLLLWCSRSDLVAPITRPTTATKTDFQHKEAPELLNACQFKASVGRIEDMQRNLYHRHVKSANSTRSKLSKAESARNTEFISGVPKGRILRENILTFGSQEVEHSPPFRPRTAGCSVRRKDVVIQQCRAESFPSSSVKADSGNNDSIRSLSPVQRKATTTIHVQLAQASSSLPDIELESPRSESDFNALSIRTKDTPVVSKPTSTAPLADNSSRPPTAKVRFEERPKSAAAAKREVATKSSLLKTINDKLILAKELTKIEEQKEQRIEKIQNGVYSRKLNHKVKEEIRRVANEQKSLLTGMARRMDESARKHANASRVQFLLDRVKQRKLTAATAAERKILVPPSSTETSSLEEYVPGGTRTPVEDPVAPFLNDSISTASALVHDEDSEVARVLEDVHDVALLHSPELLSSFPPALEAMVVPNVLSGLVQGGTVGRGTTPPAPILNAAASTAPANPPGRRFSTNTLAQSLKSIPSVSGSRGAAPEDTFLIVTSTAIPPSPQRSHVTRPRSASQRMIRQNSGNTVGRTSPFLSKDATLAVEHLPISSVLNRVGFDGQSESMCSSTRAVQLPDKMVIEIPHTDLEPKKASNNPVPNQNQNQNQIQPGPVSSGFTRSVSLALSTGKKDGDSVSYAPTPQKPGVIGRTPSIPYGALPL